MENTKHSLYTNKTETKYIKNYFRKETNASLFRILFFIMIVLPFSLWAFYNNLFSYYILFTGLSLYILILHDIRLNKKYRKVLKPGKYSCKTISGTFFEKDVTEKITNIWGISCNKQKKKQYIDEQEVIVTSTLKTVMRHGEVYHCKIMHPSVERLGVPPIVLSAKINRVEINIREKHLLENKQLLPKLLISAGISILYFIILANDVVVNDPIFREINEIISEHGIDTGKINSNHYNSYDDLLKEKPLLHSIVSIDSAYINFHEKGTNTLEITNSKKLDALQNLVNKNCKPIEERLKLIKKLEYSIASWIKEKDWVKFNVLSDNLAYEQMKSEWISFNKELDKIDTKVENEGKASPFLQRIAAQVIFKKDVMNEFYNQEADYLNTKMSEIINNSLKDFEAIPIKKMIILNENHYFDASELFKIDDETIKLYMQLSLEKFDIRNFIKWYKLKTYNIQGIIIENNSLFYVLLPLKDEFIENIDRYKTKKTKYDTYIIFLPILKYLYLILFFIIVLQLIRSKQTKNFFN